VRLVREVAAAESKPVGVLMDLGGPKLRTGPTDGGRPLDLAAGRSIRLTTLPVRGTTELISVDYPRLAQDVMPGDCVLLDDGKIELEVLAVSAEGLDSKVVFGGLLGANKGVNSPRSNLTMPPLTDRARDAVRAGVQAGVDFFGLSFVREAGDLGDARKLVASLGADTPIIAKIERRQAIDDLEAILGAADGVMVARGDLGVELPPEEVPVQQRRIIASAARHLVPVITATQMLESMVSSPRPTRAEASDVANAVWDLSDAVMLSEETAIGRYPVETVAMMDRIIRRAESATPSTPEPPASPQTDNHSYVVALAARQIVEADPNMRAVACFTRSGYTAFLLSKVHPSAPIFAVTPNEAVCRRLALARSVVPMCSPPVDSTEEMLRMVDGLLVERRLMAPGEEAVVVASLPLGGAGTTNFLKLHRVGEVNS